MYNSDVQKYPPTLAFQKYGRKLGGVGFKNSSERHESHTIGVLTVVTVMLGNWSLNGTTAENGVMIKSRKR